MSRELFSGRLFFREHFSGHHICVYTIYGIKYSRMGQVKFFKSCLSQMLLVLFLNNLSHICHIYGYGYGKRFKKTGEKGKYDMKTSHILYEPIYTKHIHSCHYLIKLWWKLWSQVFAFVKCNWQICSHWIHAVLTIIPFIVQNGLPKMMLEITS